MNLHTYFSNNHQIAKTVFLSDTIHKSHEFHATANRKQQLSNNGSYSCSVIQQITQNCLVHTSTSSSSPRPASCLWAEPQGGWTLLRPPTVCPPRAWLLRQGGHMGLGWHTAPQLGKSQSVGVDDLPALHWTSGERWPSGFLPPQNNSPQP